MITAGVHPDTATYTTLAKRLLLEGNKEEARAVLEIEMPVAGVSPNSRTLALFEKTNTVWSKLRTAYLNRLVKSATTKGRKQVSTSCCCCLELLLQSLTHSVSLTFSLAVPYSHSVVSFLSHTRSPSLSVALSLTKSPVAGRGFLRNPAH